MNKRLVRKSAPVVMLGIFLALLGNMALQAQAAPAAGASVFGSVDLQKILSGYTKKATFDQRIDALNQHLDAQFKQQLSNPMLTKDQQLQMTALLSKSSPADSDRAQITALQQESTKYAQELANLQQKKDLTDADKARLDVLTKQQASGQQALQEIADTYRNQVKAETDTLSAQLSQNVKAAIKAVAEQHGLQVVFDAQVAVYSANDITDDVLKRLNK